MVTLQRFQWVTGVWTGGVGAVAGLFEVSHCFLVVTQIKRAQGSVNEQVLQTKDTLRVDLSQGVLVEVVSLGGVEGLLGV